MANNHARSAPIYEYKPLHITATGTAVPVGNVVGLGKSSMPAIAAGTNVVVTLTASQMAGIYVGMRLNVNDGTQHEDVVVSARTPTSFTATFANSYTINNYWLTGYVPSFIGEFVVNAPGTGVAITLYNGSPNLSPLPPGAGAIAVITPATGNFNHRGKLEYGLYYTLTGTPGDYTLYYADGTPN